MSSNVPNTNIEQDAEGNPPEKKANGMALPNTRERRMVVTQILRIIMLKIVLYLMTLPTIR